MGREVGGELAHLGGAAAGVGVGGVRLAADEYLGLAAYGLEEGGDAIEKQMDALLVRDPSEEDEDREVRHDSFPAEKGPLESRLRLWVGAESRQGCSSAIQGQAGITCEAAAPAKGSQERRVEMTTQVKPGEGEGDGPGKRRKQKTITGKEAMTSGLENDG